MLECLYGLNQPVDDLVCGVVSPATQTLGCRALEVSLLQPHGDQVTPVPVDEDTVGVEIVFLIVGRRPRLAVVVFPLLALVNRRGGGAADPLSRRPAPARSKSRGRRREVCSGRKNRRRCRGRSPPCQESSSRPSASVKP